MNKDELELWEKLTKEPTVSLIQRIVGDSDRLALKVLFETRKLFRIKEEPQLSIGQYLIKLRDKFAPPEECDKDQCEIADCAYDLTLAKYSNFPGHPKKIFNSGHYHQKGTRVDCRLYYRAFLDKIQEKLDADRQNSHLQEENLAGLVLQGLINRNFSLSRLECERSSKFFVRYVWRFSGKEFTLKYPSYLTAKQFKEWLKENTKDLNLTEPDARNRIQSLINEKLERGYHVQADKIIEAYDLTQDQPPSPLDMNEGLNFTRDLAETVAQKKVENIDEQRPAIRRLGENSLECLIKEIFTELAQGNFKQGRIARKYGLSKATFSRFAGSKWSEKNKGTVVTKIPDLWRNTAKVLSENPIFMETVISSRFVDRLERIQGLVENTSEGSINNVR